MDTQFSGAILRQLGMPSVASESTTAALPVSHDVFSPRKANLLVVVDGLTSDELNLRDVELSAPRSVRASFSPSASAASLLATMLTGVSPREHGIVADKWDYLGETEHAYIHAFPDVASIADILAQSSRGESQIISASASPVFARALGVRPSLSAYAGRAASLQFDVHRSSVLQVSGRFSHPTASMTSAELKAVIRTHFRDVTLLETPEHTALYSELAMILLAVSDLSVHAQSTTVPDLYNFAITALNPIKAIHGTSVSEYTSALALIRRTIVRAIEKIQHAYDNQAIYEVLCLRTTPHTAEHVASVASQVAHLLGMPVSEVLSFWPHVNTEAISPCASLHAAGIDAFCPFSHEDRIAVQTAEVSQIADGHVLARAIIEEDSADETVAAWLMFMFMWILLLLITFYIWWAFYNMDIGEDSLLYRLTAIPTTHKEQ